MMLEQLEALRETLAKKKKKAKASSSSSNKVKLTGPEVVEVPSKSTPTMVEVTSEATIVLPPYVLPPTIPVPQLLPPIFKLMLPLRLCLILSSLKGVLEMFFLESRTFELLLRDLDLERSMERSYTMDLQDLKHQFLMTIQQVFPALIFISFFFLLIF